MSDTYQIRITATDSASPAFRSLAGEAKKTDTILDGLGDGALKALQAIERNTAEAAQGMQQFAKASQEAARASEEAGRSTKGFGENLDKIGAGAGVLVGGLSGLGQAFLSQERSVSAVTRLYGENAESMLQYAEYLQDTTQFSNDAARAAETLTGSLQNNYGFQTEQIQNLISLGTDYAALYGLELPDAVERLTAAMRGEAEGAEILGLTLNDAAVARFAAAEGITNYSSGLDEAGRAQVRYNYLVEQSAVVQGTAAEMAQTNAGQARQWVNAIQDQAQALGGALGPAAEYASVLGSFALAAPVAGAALGKIGMAARASVAGVALLGTAMGPVGLALAAVAGGAALLGLIGVFGDTEEASAGAKSGVEDVTTALYALQDAGASDAIVLQATAINTAWHQVDATLRAYNDTNQERLDAEAAALSDQLILPEVVTNQGAQDFIRMQIDSLYILGDEIDAANEDITAIVSRLGDTNLNGGQLADDLLNLIRLFQLGVDQGGISADQFIVRLDALANSVDQNYRILPEATDAVRSLVDVLNEGGSSTGFAEQLDLITVAAERMGTSVDAGLEAYIEAERQRRAILLQAAIDDPANSQTYLDAATESTANINAAEQQLADNREARNDALIAGVTAVTGAVDDGADQQLTAFDKLSDAQERRIEQDRKAAEEAERVAQARADSIQSITESYQSALGQNSFDAPFLEGLDEMVAAGDLQQEEADAIRAAWDDLASSGATTLEIINALANGLEGGASSATLFAQELDKAVQSTQAVLGLYDTIDRLGGVLQKADGIASDLFGPDGNPYDGVGVLADLYNEGRISIEEFNAASAAGIQIQEDNVRGQAALNEVRADQLPLLAEQTEALADYYERLAGYAPEEQQRILYMQDAANQQQILNLQQIAYAASIGEIPESVATEMIVDAANADPVLAGILESMGLIKIEDGVVIPVDIPGGVSAQETMIDLNATLEELVSVLAEIAGVDDPFATITERAQRLAGIDFSNLNGIGPLIGAFGDDGDGGPAVVRPVTEAPGDGIERGLPAASGPFAQPTTPTRTAPQGTPENPFDQTAYQDPARAGSESDGNIVKKITFELELDRSRFRQGLTDADGEVTAFTADPAKAILEADPAALLAAIAESDTTLKDFDGSDALASILGDNDSALASIGAAAAALFDVDGDTAELTVKGRDAYSGTINDAKRWDGALLSTSFIDIVTRRFEKSAFFADGGIVPYAANGMVLVGENGPELASLPGGTLITPSPASQQIAARMNGDGGLPTVIINNYGTISSEDDARSLFNRAAAEAVRQSRAAYAGTGAF